MMSSASTAKVSIIIPVFNGANFLAHSIRCALNQTYENLEVLVVNDGSCDAGATRDVALSFGDRIRYFEKHNGGVASALNCGIANMTGDYFSWLSHDDEYQPDKIRSQMEFLLRDSGSTRILYSDFYFMDSAARRVVPYRIYPGNLRSRMTPVLFGFINGCTLLIPRECFQRVGLFNEELKTTQDYDLWFRLARQYEFLHLPTTLVGHRLHDEQTSKVDYSFRGEADELFCSFLLKLTPNEVLSFDRSPAIFFLKLSIWLENVGYCRAAELACDFLRKCSNKKHISCYRFYYRRLNTVWRNRYGMFAAILAPSYFLSHALSRITSYARNL